MRSVKTFQRFSPRRVCGSMGFISIAREPMTGTRPVSAVPMGIIAGILAVAAGAFFDVRPPEAYGVCMACHARDLVSWTLNTLARTQLEVAPASLIFPVLTPIGVILGALVAARRKREFRWQTPESPWKAFVYGVLVMNFALLA